jgi:fucose 4-O-acetylase-like acetyltransferase
MIVTKDLRDQQIDALKGFAIILVVLGHIVAFSNPGNFQDNLLFNIIYSFHLPLFFFVSGYLVFGRFGPNPLAWTGRKFCQLIIPYLIFTIIYFIGLFGVSASNFTVSNILNTIWSYTAYSSAWFLPVLFESFVLLAIFIFLQRFLSKYIFVVYFIAICFVIPLTKLDSINGIHQIVGCTTFVFIGYLVSQYKEYIFNRLKVIEISGIILFIVLSFLKYAKILPVVNNNLFYTVYYYILALGGIILSWSIIHMITRYKISKGLIFCGIFTMEIYITHLIILNYFTFRHWPLWLGSGFFQVLTGTFSLLVLSLIASLILSYNRIIGIVLFGRWARRTLLGVFKSNIPPKRFTTSG